MAKKPVKKQQLAVSKIRPNRIDWTRIEADYCTGQFTNVELGIRHGIRSEQISRRKTADQQQDPARWQRDTSHDVARVRAAMLVDPSSLAAVKPSAVLAAAMAGVAVVMRHRGDLEQARATALALLDELGSVSKGGAGFRDLVARLATAAELDQPARQVLLDQVREFLRLHQRSSSLLKIMSALTAVHDGERRAFELDADASKRRQGEEAQLSDIERTARIMALIERGRAQKAAAALPLPQNEAVPARSEAVLPALAAPGAPEPAQNAPGQAPVH